MMTFGQNAWLASAGSWVGFLAWATSTQLNYSLVPWECDTGLRITPWVALALMLIALAGGVLSWRSFRARSQRLATHTPAAGTPFAMLAIVGMLTSLLFSLIIGLQGSAALIVMRCSP
jgi:hypothetical protein